MSEPLDLAALKRLCEGATFLGEENPREEDVAEFKYRKDAEFYLRARIQMPALIARVEELETGLRDLVVAFEKFGPALGTVSGKPTSLDRARSLLSPGPKSETEPKRCVFCDAPATCFGRYEAATEDEHACDDCCGHGCEDGHCEPLPTPSPSEAKP